MALLSNKCKNSLKSSRQMPYWKLLEFTKFRDYYCWFIAWNIMSYLKNFTRTTRCWIALIFAIWIISGDEANLIGKEGDRGRCKTSPKGNCFGHEYILKGEKQPFRGVFRKWCSGNMQQFYSCFANLLKPHFGMGVLV